MTPMQKLIQTALAEVGYIEKETNSQLDDSTANAGDRNYTKYARDIDTNYPEFYNGRKNGAEWCDIFTDWCFITAFGVDNAQKMTFQADGCSGAGCKYSAKYYKNNKRFFTAPEIGDQIFFVNSSGSINHTGIVYDVDDTYVYTVEGNTRPDGHEYGGCVAKKQYELSDPKIHGYGRPMYEIIPDEPSKDAITASFGEGDTVQIKNGVTTYADGTKMPSWVPKSTLYVRGFKSDNRVIISTLKEGAVTGTVFAADLVLIKSVSDKEDKPAIEANPTVGETKEEIEDKFPEENTNHNDTNDGSVDKPIETPAGEDVTTEVENEPEYIQTPEETRSFLMRLLNHIIDFIVRLFKK